MKIIEWNVDDIEQTVDSLDEMTLANKLVNEIEIESFDTDEIKTRDAIAVCKMKLFGEYNALLVRNMEEDLCDAEIYVLTWDGEASNGGEMFKLDGNNLMEIIKGTIFGGSNK
ncbi:hypothetical protein OEA_28275 (plasmid) [Priestia megaterium NCT-2]|uniref:hypothetical protein n=1 Tax=Priestia megaterium TaxID=1404 RepID=UPI000345A189|nr:hypothetical protein [Priestia megaterium]AYE53564.1 hypothetical protein OEA_28275 [Priestia megaterium NCT-2]